MSNKKVTPHQRRKMRIRTKLKRNNRAGLPRLSVFRSGRNISAQVIDDVNGITLVSASSLDADIREAVKNGANVDGASAVGKALGEKAVKAGVKKVMFDRSGYLYHGRIKALAEGAREAGMEF